MKMRSIMFFMIGVLVFIGLLIAVGQAKAQSGSWRDASGTAGGSYVADSPYEVKGHAKGVVDAPIGDNDNFKNKAYSWSGQKAASDALAIGKKGEKEYVAINADVYQATGASVDHGNTWAYGQEQSGAGYDVDLTRKNRAGLEGEACTLGGTYVKAKEFTKGDLVGSKAFAVTGSMGGAEVDRLVDPYAWGEGSVNIGTYVTDNRGFAGNYAGASYLYDNNANGAVEGSGFAKAGGKSTLNTNLAGDIIAKSKSFAFSSTGSGAYTSGQVQATNR